jgi:hypothetical protein
LQLTLLIDRSVQVGLTGPRELIHFV